MNPSQAPLVPLRAVSSTVFATLKGGEGGEDKDEAEEAKAEQAVAEEAGETVVVPDEKGGGEGTTLFDITPSKGSSSLKAYTKMLDKEYGLVVDSKTNSWSLRIGGDIVSIPTFSQYLAGGEKADEKGRQSGSDGQAR
jgi:hypothetical protein